MSAYKLPLVAVSANESLVSCPQGYVAYRPLNFLLPHICLPSSLNLAFDLDEALEDYCSDQEKWWDYLGASLLSLTLLVILVITICNCRRNVKLNSKLHAFVPGNDRHPSLLRRLWRRLFGHNSPEPGAAQFRQADGVRVETDREALLHQNHQGATNNAARQNQLGNTGRDLGMNGHQQGRSDPQQGVVRTEVTVQQQQGPLEPPQDPSNTPTGSFPPNPFYHSNALFQRPPPLTAGELKKAWEQKQETQ